MPCYDRFYLSNKANILGVQLFNIHSKMIKDLNLSEMKQYDISDVEPGVYFIRALLPNG